MLQFLKWNKTKPSWFWFSLALAGIYPSCQSTSWELQLSYFMPPFSYMDHVPPFNFPSHCPLSSSRGLAWSPQPGHSTGDNAALLGNLGQGGESRTRGIQAMVPMGADTAQAGEFSARLTWQTRLQRFRVMVFLSKENDCLCPSPGGK